MAEQALLIPGFSGLDLELPPGSIPDDALSECLNFDIGRGGQLVRRTGFSSLATLADQRGLVGYLLTATKNRLLSSGVNGTYRSIDGVTHTLINAFIADHTAQYGDTSYWVRSASTGASYDGTTYTARPTIPAGDFCTFFKDRLFVLNSTNFASRLSFSDPGSPLVFDAASFFDFNPGDGDRLVACIPVQDALLVFKTQSTWLLNVEGDPAFWTQHKINNEIGCIAKNTVVEVDGWIWFLSPDGIYRTNGIDFEPASPALKSALTLVSPIRNNVSLASACLYKDKFVMHHENGYYYIFNLASGTWTRWLSTAKTHKRLIYVEDNTAGDTSVLPVGLYLIDPVSFKVFRFGDVLYLDDGNIYTSTMSTKDFNFGKPGSLKRSQKVYIDIEGAGNITVDHYLNGTLHLVRVYSTQALRKSIKVKGPGIFRNWRTRIEFSDVGSLIVYGIEVWLAEKDTVSRSD